LADCPKVELKLVVVRAEFPFEFIELACQVFVGGENLA
jgi:hypothetical protein